MPDIADIAQEVIDNKLAQQIEKAKVKQHKNKFDDCQICGEPLNEFRRENFYSTCVPCKEDLE